MNQDEKIRLKMAERPGADRAMKDREEGFRLAKSGETIKVLLKPEK